MRTDSPGLRETVVRGLAKVGLIWALTVLGAVFAGTSALAQREDGGYRLPSVSATQEQASEAVPTGGAPRTAGLALALAVLGGGVTVLAVGASRGDRATLRGRGVRTVAGAGPDPSPDLSLALGLGLLS